MYQWRSLDLSRSSRDVRNRPLGCVRQWRFRSACTLAHFGQQRTQSFIMPTVKTLITLCGWADWFGSLLGTHVRRYHVLHCGSFIFVSATLASKKADTLTCTAHNMCSTNLCYRCPDTPAAVCVGKLQKIIMSSPRCFWWVPTTCFLREIRKCHFLGELILVDLRGVSTIYLP